MNNSDDPKYQQFREDTEAHLWEALEALDKGDLPTVRRSASIARNNTIDYWRNYRKTND